MSSFPNKQISVASLFIAHYFLIEDSYLRLYPGFVMKQENRVLRVAVSVKTRNVTPSLKFPANYLWSVDMLVTVSLLAYVC